MSGTHDAKFYLQLRPTFGKRWFDGEYVDTVTKVTAETITQKRPQRPRGGTVTVKLTVRVPDGAFLPLRPEAIVVIPENMAIVNPIEVTAEDPDSGDDDAGD